MQIIKPKQISGEIMTLFEDAKEKVIIISPYYKISKWYKLLNCLDDLKKRNISVEFYVREDALDSINELKEFDFHPVCIRNLHTKLYLNEKSAIVSSMNLLLSSDTNSLDIALKSETKKEYDDLLEYYTRYIKTNSSLQELSVHQNKNYNWRDDLEKKLFLALGGEPYISEEQGKICVKIYSTYEISIHNGITNNLIISGILTSKEFSFALINKNIFESAHMTLEFIEGNNRYNDRIRGTMKNFKSRSINELEINEENAIVNIIVKFIAGIEQLKTRIKDRVKNQF